MDCLELELQIVVSYCVATLSSLQEQQTIFITKPSLQSLVSNIIKVCCSFDLSWFSNWRNWISQQFWGSQNMLIPFTALQVSQCSQNIPEWHYSYAEIHPHSTSMFLDWDPTLSHKSCIILDKSLDYFVAQLSQETEWVIYKNDSEQEVRATINCKLWIPTRYWLWNAF